MQNLSEYLKARLEQLEQRKRMIPRYIERPGAFLGKKDFSLNDLPVIQKQIDECRAAIKAVEAHRKGLIISFIEPVKK